MLRDPRAFGDVVLGRGDRIQGIRVLCRSIIKFATKVYELINVGFCLNFKCAQVHND